MPVITFLLFFLALSFLPAYPAQAAHKAEPVITIHGSTDYGFSHPTSLFMDFINKRIYAVDGGKNILLLFNNNLEFLADFDNEGELQTPISTVKDSKGRFYIVEAGKGRLMFFDLDAEVSRPLDLGEKVIPGSLTIDDEDNIYVVNRLKSNIFKFSSDLMIPSEISLQEQQLRLTDIWIDGEGRLYSVDPIARKVFVFNQQGRLLLSFGEKGAGKGKLLFPVSVSTFGNLILVVDAHRKKVISFDENGRFVFEFGHDGIGDGQLSSPTFVRADWEGRIYVINRDPPKIEVFRFVK
jgi:hypothetical protein